MRMGDEGAQVKVNAIPTGALSLDLALGIGGVPRGRIVEVFGPESSGKTTLVYHMLAEAQKLGGVCAFIDAEHAMDPLYAQQIGVDIDELLVSQPDYGEQALEIADMLVRSGAVDVVAVDSVAALTPRAELEGQMGDQTVGLQARMMSQAMRKLAGNLNRTQTLCLFTNQIREKVGVMFGSPETQPGGRALKFYSSQRLDIRRIETLKDGTEAVGNRVRVKVVKNKVAAPFRQAEFDIEFGKGISTSGCILDLGIEHNVVTKSGSFFSYGDERLGQGRNNAKAFLDEHPEIAKEIEDKVYEALGIDRDLVCRSSATRRSSCRTCRGARRAARRGRGGLVAAWTGWSRPACPERAALDPEAASSTRSSSPAARSSKRDRTVRRGAPALRAQARRAGGRRRGADRADRAPGYLDDARYARRFAEDRRRARRLGPRAHRAPAARARHRPRAHRRRGRRAGRPTEELRARARRCCAAASPTRRPTSASATARSACSCAAATSSTSPTTRCAATRASRPSPSSERRSATARPPFAPRRRGTTIRYSDRPGPRAAETPANQTLSARDSRSIK